MFTFNNGTLCLQGEDRCLDYVSGSKKLEFKSGTNPSLKLYYDPEPVNSLKVSKDGNCVVLSPAGVETLIFTSSPACRSPVILNEKNELRFPNDQCLTGSLQWCFLKV